MPVIVTIANREIVLDRPAEATKRQHQRFEMAAVFAVDVDAEAPFRRFELDPVRPGVVVGVDTLRREVVAFQQVEDRDPTLLLDIGRTPADAVLVECDVDDPRVGHRRPIGARSRYDNSEFVRRGSASL
jgi:hypothetical protein